MNYKKKRLTDKQFQINNRQKYDSKVTDSLLKDCGLSPSNFASMPLVLVQARLAVVELKKFHWHLLTKQETKAINKFNSKLINKKKYEQLKTTSAYLILNLATKIKRKAHKEELQQRQEIKQ
jgi:hypothetical protein